jgi:aminocarboxymuconate-semialdehyde decarboxylase
MTVIIDAHAHFVPPEFLDEVASGRRKFPSVNLTAESGAYRFSFANNDAKRPVPPGMSDTDKRKKWLAEHGIDKQVVGGWLDVFGYDIPADEGADWSRYFNEHLLKGVKAHPFLVPLATVPLQSGKHAAKVLEEAMDSGFSGAMIGTQPKGATGVLDDPDLEPFWDAASRRKATLFVHPTFGAPDDRLNAYGLVSAVGRVTDTTIAVARLLYSGHLTRYPGVNLVISHGGAALPMVLGRLRRSFATAPARNKDPMEGFKRLYFDTIVYDVNTLRFVCEQAGADKILMGTDAPFTIAEPEPVQFVDAAKFGAADRAAIMGGTAAKLFRIGA